jgi:hypothetical protein
MATGNRHQKNLSLNMRPDYPQKMFNDKRTSFPLLMETLAMGSD